jgi:hypothetical protein
MKLKNYFFALVGTSVLFHHVVLKDASFDFKNAINPYSKLVNSSNIKILKKLGEQKINIQGLNKEQVINKIALDQLKEKRYFLSLASYAEGFIPHLYHDNRGYALGMGWNLTQQNHFLNYELANTVYSNPHTVQQIADINNHHNKINYWEKKEIKITPNQALQVSYLMKEYIQNDILLPNLAKYLEKNHKIHHKYALEKATYIFSKLHKNEQDALIYHVYKVGGNGLLKYHKLLKNIIVYAEHRNIKNKEKVIEQFNYYYIKNHHLYDDKKASLLVASMFDSPLNFQKMILYQKDKIVEDILAKNDKKIHKKYI